MDRRDFMAFRLAMFSTAGQGNFNSAFDLDGDNVVDAGVFLQFVPRFLLGSI